MDVNLKFHFAQPKLPFKILHHTDQISALAKETKINYTIYLL